MQKHGATPTNRELRFIYMSSPLTQASRDTGESDHWCGEAGGEPGWYSRARLGVRPDREGSWECVIGAEVWGMVGLLLGAGG
jgi:hypothetical protein